MDGKNKILLSVLILLIIYAIGATYYRIFIARDYQIVAEISCDPETESCFVWEDEETGEVSYYKLINKNAANIPLCDPNEDKCEELSCRYKEKNCEIIFCDPMDIPADEICL